MLISDCYLEIDFEFVPLEHKLMQVTVSHTHNKIFVTPELVNGSYLATTRINITLPTQVMLEFSGKGPNDTVVDAVGNITADLMVKIISIKLDGFVVDQNLFYRLLVLTSTDNSIWNGPIIGFNGTMNIDLNKDNVFSQFMALINQ
jgi:hypothetical protein